MTTPSQRAREIAERLIHGDCRCRIGMVQSWGECEDCIAAEIEPLVAGLGGAKAMARVEAKDADRLRALVLDLREALREAEAVTLKRPHDGSQLDEDLEGLLLTIKPLLARADEVLK